jgi:hypothetical protein
MWRIVGNVFDTEKYLQYFFIQEVLAIFFSYAVKEGT